MYPCIFDMYQTSIDQITFLGGGTAVGDDVVLKKGIERDEKSKWTINGCVHVFFDMH